MSVRERLREWLASLDENERAEIRRELEGNREGIVLYASTPIDSDSPPGLRGSTTIVTDSVPVPVESGSGPAPQTGKAIGFTELGLGKPLKITLERVYVGADQDYSGRLLVTSRAKASGAGEAATVALNWFGENLRPRTMVPLDDASAGSDVVYYSPAESADKIELSINLKFDRFDRAQWNAWREAAAGIGSLPVVIGGFAAGGAGGAAAGQAIVGVANAGADLVISLLDNAIDGRDGIAMTMDVAVARPGRLVREPGFVLLFPDNFVESWQLPDGSTADRSHWYVYDEGWAVIDDEVQPKYLEVDGANFYVDLQSGRLRHKVAGEWPGYPGWRFDAHEEVRGPWPYALVLVNGAEDDSLKKWKPAAVAAELAAEFLARESREKLPAQTAKVFSAFFDASLVQKASDLDSKISALEKSIKKANAAENLDEKEIASLTEKKALYEKQRDATIESIQTDALRELVKK